MTHTIRTITILAGLVAAACGNSRPPTTPPDDPPKDTPTPALAGDDAMLEAVLLHEIAAAKPAAADALCLRVRTADGATGDASADLLAAIQRKHPTATAASACTGGGPDVVTVIATGGPALMFDVGPVKQGPDGPRVPGGGHHRGGSSGIYEVEYRLALDGGGVYRVVDEQVTSQN